MVKAANRPNICYIFRKEMVRGHQKQCSQLSDIQIQIHKKINTHIHKYTNTDSVKVPNRPNMAYIFEKVMVRGPQKECSQVSDMQIHKYNYTNTQIQFGSNLQIDLTCAIFLKR